MRAPVVLLVIAAFLSAVPAAAQEPGPDPEVPSRPQRVTPDVDRLLQQRGREVLHPDVPLDLRGAEEEGNDFRGRTPALRNHDAGEAVYVDPDENYRRRLAMYAGEERFTSSLPAPSAEAAPAPPPPPPAPEPAPAVTEERKTLAGLPGWLWGMLVTGLGLGVVALARRLG